jgi:hypothetical protein
MPQYYSTWYLAILYTSSNGKHPANKLELRVLTAVNCEKYRLVGRGTM